MGRSRRVFSLREYDSDAQHHNSDVTVYVPPRMATNPPLPPMVPGPRDSQPRPAHEPKTDRRSGSYEAQKAFFHRVSKGEPERRKFRDRRATSRVRINLPLEIVDGPTILHLETTDLSTFGLSIQTGCSFVRGTRLQLRMALPDRPGEPFKIVGEVVAPYGINGGIRLKFVSPEIDVTKRIHRLLR